MRKSLIPLTVLSGLIFANCTHPAADVKADKPINIGTEKTQSDALDSEPVKTQNRSRANPSESAQTVVTPTEDTSSIYWVKAVGTLVYDAQRQFVRSLRFQPKVKILTEVDGWGLIDATQDEWVKMSDLTRQKPDNILSGPDNATGLPRVKIEDVFAPDDR